MAMYKIAILKATQLVRENFSHETPAFYCQFATPRIYLKDVITFID